MSLARITLDRAPQAPREFRIFRKGRNESVKGAWLFDDAAAASVMAAYRAQGNELPLDLEHESVTGGRTDAMAWFKLALRSGELWAIDVRFTAEGLARLQARSQRYISPCFNFEPDTRRVVELVNCGLVAMPALHHAPALCSARLDRSMSPIEKKLAAVFGVGNDVEALRAALEEALAGLELGDNILADTPDAPSLKLSRGMDRAVAAHCKRHGITREQFATLASRRTRRAP